MMRRRGVYFGAWKRWAPRKHALSRLKRIVAAKAELSRAKRSLGMWNRTVNNNRLLVALQIALRVSYVVERTDVAGREA